MGQNQQFFSQSDFRNAIASSPKLFHPLHFRWTDNGKDHLLRWPVTTGLSGLPTETSPVKVATFGKALNFIGISIIFRPKNDLLLSCKSLRVRSEL